MSVDLVWLAQQFPELQSLASLDVGGQKTVYAATHAFDGDVVLKIIKPGADPQRTDREMLAVQQVRSPRVPQIIEHGVLC